MLKPSQFTILLSEYPIATVKRIDLIDLECGGVNVLPFLHGEVKRDYRLLVQRTLCLWGELPLRRGHQVGGSREGARLVEVRRVRLRSRPLPVLVQEELRDLWRDCQTRLDQISTSIVCTH